MEKKIRSPIIATVGHVDHGKTTLLDKIRGTAVVKAEAGAITQHISSSYIPIEVFKKVCGKLLEKLKIDIEMPGLLFIDTPGHEAFTTLRKRGGAIADLAILVIDINEGFQPQTDESLNFLKQFKTPFVVAATKIDKILGWNPKSGACFSESFREQSQRAQDELEKKIYMIVSQLTQRGFQTERFDRVKDFAKQVSVVPVSGVTGEGIADLLVVLAGIAQKYLKGRLEVTSGEGKGTVLEVKEFRGMGTTIDVILYDGEIKRGNYLVIGGSTKEDAITIRIKALLQPEPLRELRIEKNFIQMESVSAASGVKIAAPGLEKVIAGSPLRVVANERDIEKARSEIAKEIEEVEIETEREGVILRADTLGGLEALIKSLHDIGLPIRKALVGDVSKSDILEIRTLGEPVIFAFNVKIPEDVKKLAKDNKVALFHSDVIYKLIEDYKKFEQNRKKREEERLLEMAVRPGRIKVLPGYVFRQSKPAVFGIEVLKGVIKPEYRLKIKEKIIGEIKEIQSQGENMDIAKSGDKVAISMPEVTIGKEVKEGDVLDVHLTEDDLKVLEKIKHKLSDDEIELLEEGK